MLKNKLSLKKLNSNNNLKYLIAAIVGSFIVAIPVQLIFGAVLRFDFHKEAGIN